MKDVSNLFALLIHDATASHNTSIIMSPGTVMRKIVISVPLYFPLTDNTASNVNICIVNIRKWKTINYSLVWAECISNLVLLRNGYMYKLQLHDTIYSTTTLSFGCGNESTVKDKIRSWLCLYKQAPYEVNIFIRYSHTTAIFYFQ